MTRGAGGCVLLGVLGACAPNAVPPPPPTYPPVPADSCPPGAKLHSLDAEGLTACALTCDGRVWCWGTNEHGQLGQGTHGPLTKSGWVKDLPPVVQVSVNSTSVCALATDGSVWCWGVGALGTGVPSSDLPVRVDGLPPAVRVQAFEAAACAVTDDGEVWWWGAYLALTPGAAYSDTPVPLGSFLAEVMPWYAPNVPFEYPLQACTPNPSSPIILDAAGDLWGWGEPSWSGSTEFSKMPVKIASGIASMGDETSTFQCAITADRTLLCWGAVTVEPNPVPGATGTGLLQDISLVATGIAGAPGEACALAEGGGVYCFDPVLQTDAPFTIPIEYPDFGKPKDLAVGFHAVCALVDDRIMCQGCDNLIWLAAPSKTCVDYPVEIQVPFE